MVKTLKKIWQKNKILIFIILLAAILRFVYPDNPPSLNWDEVSHGYNAYSILKTGRDEWGSFFPIIFRAYGDYKLPFYIYTTTITELLFGLTPFAVRLPSVLAGIGIVFFTYKLVKLLLSAHKNDSQIAFLASLLVAIEPWSFFISRAAFEANLAAFLFIAGIYYFLYFLSSKRKSHLILFTVFLGLTVWTYNSYRIFTPLMIIFAIFIYRKSLKTIYNKTPNKFYPALLLSVVFFIPMFYQLMTSVGQARYSWVEILDQGTIARVNEARGNGGSRIVNNKLTYFFLDFSKNYISHFSTGYLFIKGGSNYQFSVPGEGVLYLIDAPFLIIGLLLILKGVLKKEKWAFLSVIWIVLAPIPSSLTREAPHVLRSVTFLPLPMFISALGVIKVFSFVTRYTKLFLYLSYFLLLSFLSFRYMHIYFSQYKNNFSESWQYGYTQTSLFIEKHYSGYDKIVITKKYGEPHEFMLFNLKWSPQKYVSDPKLNRFFQTNWYWVDGFDKFYFINDWQIVDKSLGNYTFKQESGGLVQCTPKMFKCLLVTSPDNVPENWNKLETINFLDGSNAFEFYEN